VTRIPRAGLWSWASLAVFGVVDGSAPALADPGAAPPPEISHLDLAKPFSTRSAWRLVTADGPQTVDDLDEPAPGPLHLCLEAGASGPCISDQVTTPKKIAYVGWEPHYLRVAKPVYPSGQSEPPLLLIVTSSLPGINGNEVLVTQLLKYVKGSDRFERIYAHATTINNNQEVRFVTSGLLRGSVISAEPTDNAPYAYWIEVSRFTAARNYQRVLRYRSATRYNDGNSLAVIDSEMPNIERRLGLWRPGSPLPTPNENRCLRAHLKRGELFCE